MRFDHQEFVLQLTSDWQQRATNDSEQFVFESPAKQTTLTVSVVAAGVPKPRLLEVARHFLGMREQAERIDRTRKITFGDKHVELKPFGDVAEIAYAGYDDRGRIFRFFGFVTEAKVLSFYCETVTTDNEFSKQTFDEAFKSFKFFVP